MLFPFAFFPLDNERNITEWWRNGLEFLEFKFESGASSNIEFFRRK
jgi:hypothetical protein